MHIIDLVKDTFLWSTFVSVLPILERSQSDTLKADLQIVDKPSNKPVIDSTSQSHLPLVIWHGMGDSYNSSSIQNVKEIVREIIPDLFIHSIYIDEDDSKDSQASILGNLNNQIDEVCDQLNDIAELSKGFNAIGFSQGGLFLRAATEKCGLPINNLITFGSPHNGVSDLPSCKSGDWLCKRRNALLKGQVWNKEVQEKIVQAQYFRDPAEYEKYIKYSNFLVFLNNELLVEPSYRDNLLKLNKLVMVMFKQDGMITPKESAWFYDVDGETSELIPFTRTQSFTYDLIGLRTLYVDDKIDFRTIDDEHMRISTDDLIDIANSYL